MELRTNYEITLDVMNLFFSSSNDLLIVEDTNCQSVQIHGVSDKQLMTMFRNFICSGSSVLQRISELDSHSKDDFKEIADKLTEFFAD